MPGPAAVRLLLPAQNKVAASRAMLRFSAALSVTDSVKRVAVSGVLRTGSAAAIPWRIDVEDHPGSVRAWLADVLGEPVDFSLGLGTARANRKPVLEVFDRRGRRLAFAKVGETPLAETHVQAEASALATLGERGAPRGVTVPRIVHCGRWEGMLILIMSTLDTTWRQRPSRQWDLPVSEMDALHAHFAGGVQPLTAMPAWGLLEQARDGLVDEEVRGRFGAALAELGDRAATVPLTTGAWHGDWTPWNMSRGSRGSRSLQLWDWERFEEGVPSGLDRAHYAVNATLRRDGASVAAVHHGLAWAGRDHRRPAEAGLEASAYLAMITGRYLLGAQSDLGDAVRPRSLLMLQAWEQWLSRASA